MKRILVLCLMLCLLALSMPGYAADEDVVLGVVNCESWVSLRKEPSTSAKRLAKLPKGALVTYISSGGNRFTFVRYGKLEGYVLTRYIAPQSLAMVAGNCSSYITLREHASTSAKAIAKIKKGTPVLRVDDVVNGFFRVCYNGKYGYVLSKYLLRAETKHGTAKRVVKCQSYISLRKLPSVKSDRLAKIPLGAYVTSFGTNGYGMEYVYYDGQYGFVLSKYLANDLQYNISNEEVKKFPFEGEISDAILLEKGGLSVYKKPAKNAKKIGKISAPNIMVMGEVYSLPSNGSSAKNPWEMEVYSHVKWWDSASNTIRSGYIKDSELSGCITSHSTEWNYALTGYIGKTIEENVRLRGGPLNGAVSIAKLRKGSHLYVLGSAEGNWLYVSTYPFSSYLDDDKSQEEHKEGWIQKSAIRFVGKW